MMLTPDFITTAPKFRPVVDPEFVPVALWNRGYRERLRARRAHHVPGSHGLADKHDTHVAVALWSITALQAVGAEVGPKKKAYGCKTWRHLDWLLDADKQALRFRRGPTWRRLW
jgi:hypothetical protein